MPDTDLNIIAVDTAINSDGHAPGIAQPVTLAEIKDIYMSDRPKQERLEQLNALRQEMVSRDAADVEAGFDALIKEIDQGIAYLNKTSDGSASSATLTKSA